MKDTLLCAAVGTASNHNGLEGSTVCSGFGTVSEKTKEAICVKRNTRALSLNQCCCGKAISILYSECVSAALVIQHAKRMRPVILSYVASLALAYFPTLPNKRHDFRKES
jgi:Fe2+ transport system protein B